MNFRKLTALLAAVMILVSNAGFALTVHYCEGKIASISSGFAEAEVCDFPKAKTEKSCCGKEIQVNHKKCCSDKTLEFKGKIADILAKYTTEIASPFLIPFFQTAVFATSGIVQTKSPPSYYCDAHAPPLFKLHHQFLFYA